MHVAIRADGLNFGYSDKVPDGDCRVLVNLNTENKAFFFCDNMSNILKVSSLEFLFYIKIYWTKIQSIHLIWLYSH